MKYKLQCLGGCHEFKLGVRRKTIEVCRDMIALGKFKIKTTMSRQVMT